MSSVEVKFRIFGDFRKASEIAKDVEEKIEKAFGTDKAGITSFKVAVDEKELEIPSIVIEMNNNAKNVDVEVEEEIEEEVQEEEEEEEEEEQNNNNNNNNNKPLRGVREDLDPSFKTDKS